MLRAGFIGLGTLGKAIAGRLIAQEVEVTVWNRTPEKAVGLKATVAESPGQVAAASDLIFLNLFDSSAVHDVLAGPGGILESDCRGNIIVDTTTNHFERVKEFHRMVASAGGSYLEAPVLGSVVPASQGALTVLVSGDRNAFERAKRYLEIIGKNIFFLGKPGLATRMKLVNNMVLGAFMATLAEAVALGEDVGLAKSTVLEILGAGAGRSGILEAKREKLLHGDFSAQFTCGAIAKDLRYLEELEGGTGDESRAGAFARDVFALALSSGLEKEDFSAVYTLFRRRASHRARQS